MATMTGAHAANENDKIAPPHGSPSSRGPYPISQRCVVHHSNFGALCRLGVIHVISAIPACPVRPKSGRSANARVYEYTLAYLRYFLIANEKFDKGTGNAEDCIAALRLRVLSMSPRSVRRASIDIEARFVLAIRFQGIRRIL